MARSGSLHHRYGGAALVTGASSGLGEVFAQRLAQSGFDVVLVARRRDRLEKIAAAIEKKTGVKCTIVVEDLAITGSVERVFAEVANRGIDLGVIVNNAGFGTYAEFAETVLDDQTSMVDLNCRAVVEIAHRGAILLKTRGRGAIIITSSVLGHFSLPLMATYSATKAFNLQLAEAMWAELRPYGVHVQALCPGPTETEFHTRSTSPTRTGLRMMTCRDVVELSLRRLGGGPVVIPGLQNRFLVGMMGMLPSGLRMRMLAMGSGVGRNPAK